MSPSPATRYYQPSVFGLPDIKSNQCNNLNSCRVTPFAHAQYDNCPLHRAGKPAELSDHERWAKSRDLFITTPTEEAREAAFDLMLSYVTDTCPPEATVVVPEHAKPGKVWSASPSVIGAIGLVCCLLAIICLIGLALV